MCVETIHYFEGRNYIYDRYLGCLFSSRSDWRVLQRSCQPTPTPIYKNLFAASVSTKTNTGGFKKTEINECFCTAGSHFVLLKLIAQQVHILCYRMSLLQERCTSTKHKCRCRSPSQWPRYPPQSSCSSTMIFQRVMGLEGPSFR